MNSHYKPTGSVTLPAMMCGVAAAALAIGLSIMGYFEDGDLWLKGEFAKEPFYLVEPEFLNEWWGYVAAVIGGWFVAVAVMDSAGWWRRCLVGAMSFVVAVGFSPVLMLWGIYWSPIILVVAVVWGWFCAMVYSGQHLMPCDVPFQTVSEVDDKEVVDITEDEEVLPFAEEEPIQVETITFPVRFKSVDEDVVEDKEGAERWQPKIGNGED